MVSAGALSRWCLQPVPGAIAGRSIACIEYHQGRVHVALHYIDIVLHYFIVRAEHLAALLFRTPRCRISYLLSCLTLLASNTFLFFPSRHKWSSQKYSKWFYICRIQPPRQHRFPHWKNSQNRPPVVWGWSMERYCLKKPNLARALAFLGSPFSGPPGLMSPPGGGCAKPR